MFVTKALIYERFPEKQSQKEGPHSYSLENENRHNSQFGLSILGRPANPSNFDESLYVPKKILSFHGAFFSKSNRRLGIVSSRKIDSNKHSPSCWGNIGS